MFGNGLQSRVEQKRMKDEARAAENKKREEVKAVQTVRAAEVRLVFRDSLQIIIRGKIHGILFGAEAARKRLKVLQISGCPEIISELLLDLQVENSLVAEAWSVHISGFEL